MPNQVEPEGYTVKQFCDAIPMSHTKFYAELAAGRLHAKKLGRRTIVTREEKHRYIEALPDYQSTTA